MASNIRLPKMGIDNVNTRPQGGYVRAATNIDLHDDGSFARRGALVPVDYDAPVHSLFYSQAIQRFLFCTTAGVFVFSNSLPLTPLHVLPRVNTVHAAYTDYRNELIVSVDGELYVINTALECRAFTVPHVGLPYGISVQTGGQLCGGTYAVGVCLEELSTGKLGAMSPLSTFDVPDNGAISLTLPTDMFDGAMYVLRVFITCSNGSALRDCGFLGSPGMVLRITTDAAGMVAPTQGLVNMHGGEGLVWVGGRLLSYSGDMLYLSDPLMPHLLSPLTGFMRFAGILFVERTQGNDLFVGDARGVWLVRDVLTADRTTQTLVDAFVPLSVATSVQAGGLHKNVAPDQTTLDVVVWLTARGYVIGYPDGKVIHATPTTLQVNAVLDDNTPSKTFAYVTPTGVAQVVTVRSERFLNEKP